MSVPKVVINLTPSPVESFVEVNGVRLDGVFDVAVHQRVGEIPAVTIQMWGEVSIEGEMGANIEIRDPIREDRYLEHLTEEVARRITTDLSRQRMRRR